MLHRPLWWRGAVASTEEQIDVDSASDRMMGSLRPTGHRWPLEALFGEAHPLTAHEAAAGVCQPKERREPGDLTH